MHPLPKLISKKKSNHSAFIKIRIRIMPLKPSVNSFFFNRFLFLFGEPRLFIRRDGVNSQTRSNWLINFCRKPLTISFPNNPLTEHGKASIMDCLNPANHLPLLFSILFRAPLSKNHKYMRKWLNKL